MTQAEHEELGPLLKKTREALMDSWKLFPKSTRIGRSFQGAVKSLDYLRSHLDNEVHGVSPDTQVGHIYYGRDW